MMRVAYNTKDGKVFRVLKDDEKYHPGVAHSFVEIPLGNDDLLNALSDSPETFVYDGKQFTEDDTTVWEIDTKAVDGKTEVNAADFDAMQKAAQTAKDLAALKAVVSNLILAVARLSESEGMTPVTPAAEVGP